MKRFVQATFGHEQQKGHYDDVLVMSGLFAPGRTPLRATGNGKAVARPKRNGSIPMHIPMTSRATPGIPPGLPAGGASESVLTASGVQVTRMHASPGNRLALNVPASAAFGLIMATLPDAGPRPLDHAGTMTLVANYSRGDTLDVPMEQDLLFAHLPETAFENVSGRWQLVAAPLATGIHQATDDPAARYLCLALLSRPGAATPLESIFVNSLSLALLTHFLNRYCPVQSSRDDEPGIRLEPWQLRIAEETMLARLDRRLPISMVAERCGVSAVHFSRAFRRTTSETPHRWLMRRRLEKACALLVSTEETIADIALACGFSDQSHLTRTFSLLIGTTPACWRALQRRAGISLPP